MFKKTLNAVLSLFLLSALFCPLSVDAKEKYIQADPIEGVSNTASVNNVNYAL